MIKLKKILVPTDFSENAKLGLDYAKEFATTFGAEVIVVHITEPPIYPIGPGMVPVAWESMESDIRAYTDKHLQEAKESFGEAIKVKVVHREGAPFVELIKLAKEEDVHMIIMSTHGYTGLKHMLLGSTTEKVVRKAHCPVLTVRPSEQEFVHP